MKRCWLILFVVTNTFLARAAQEGTNLNTVQITDLPAAACEALTNVAKGASILQIVKSPATYSVRLDTKGQKSELRVTAEGKSLRIRSKQEAEARFEEERRLAQAGKLKTIPLDDLPAAAREVITQKSNGATIEQIVKAPATYIAQIERTGEKTEIRVTEDGNVLSPSTAGENQPKQ